MNFQARILHSEKSLHLTDSGKVVDDDRLKFPATDITQLTQVFYIELTVVSWFTMYRVNEIQ